MDLRLALVIFSFALILSPILSDLILSKVDRRIDLTSQTVRITSTLKVENAGTNKASEVILTFSDNQAKNLAYLIVTHNEGKTKASTSTINLPVEIVHPKMMPSSLTAYSVSLPKGLENGESSTIDVFSVFTHSLQPFPEKITQADIQLFVYQDSAHYLSRYSVQVQSLTIKLPEARIESYTRLDGSKIHGSEIKYGPYENLPSFSYSPIVIHFESNQPFAVAEKLVREIEISHWGNVQVTEHYNVIHKGAQSKGEFSRLDYQARPHLRGASAIKKFVAKLPPRAHSVYYRDEIGNISTSHLWGSLRKIDLEIEPRYPMFGGWRTTFTIGYGLPLQGFLFESGEKRFLNIFFGSPINDLIIDNLILKVVLPEGSSDISVSVPFSVKQWEEIKFSHLDIIGRPVVVLQKNNVVKEHSQHFQVYYTFSTLSLLREPLMLICGFFILFITCILYAHIDFSISKSSASYLAKLQWDEVRTTIQQIKNIIDKSLRIHDKLESSLRDLSRTGDVQACKATRKADGLFKDLSKELKPLLAFLQSSPQAAHILPKIDELVSKEKELQDKLILKHMTVVDSFEKKSRGQEFENRISVQQQKISVLRQEVDELLEFVDEI